NRTAEQKPEEEIKKRPRHACGQPVGEPLHRGDERQRQRPRGQHVERAVLVVVVKDAVGREKSSEQQRDPQHAWRDAREQIEVRAKPERCDGDYNKIEAERRADRAALAEGEPHVAGEERERRLHVLRFPPRAILCPNLVLSAVWLATMAMPPASRCSLIAASSSLSEGASRETCGSSSSQIGRGAA